MLAAVRWYFEQDEAALLRLYEERVQYLIDALSNVRGVSARRSFPSEAGQPMPRTELIFDEATLGMTRDEILEKLLAGNPPILLADSDDRGVFINPQTLSEGQERTIAARLGEMLNGTS